jgi:hypothetical protein
MSNEHPIMPKAQIVYGDVVYWICVISAVLCMVGPLVAVMDIDSNVANPHFLFSAIWEGKDAIEVWRIAGEKFPGGHFWIDNMHLGDGLTHFGLVLGGGVALPALLAASVFYLKDRMYLWAGMSVWVCILILISATGIVGMGH